MYLCISEAISKFNLIYNFNFKVEIKVLKILKHKM